MCAQSMRILVVGLVLPSTRATLGRLGGRGWVFERADLLADARRLLEASRFDIILASEFLPDGRGYELIPFAEACGGSLLVAVALSGGCLWLPVVEGGVRMLGMRGVNMRLLETEMDGIMVRRSGKLLKADAQITGVLSMERAALGRESSVDARASTRPSFPSMGAGTRNGLSAFGGKPGSLPRTSRAVRALKAKGKGR